MSTDAPHSLTSPDTSLVGSHNPNLRNSLQTDSQHSLSSSGQLMKNYSHSKAAQQSVSHKQQIEPKIQPSTMDNIPIDLHPNYQISTGCSWCTQLLFAMVILLLIVGGGLTLFLLKEILFGAILLGIGVALLIGFIICLYRQWSAAKNNKQLLTEITESNMKLSKLKLENQTLAQKMSAANKENQEMKQRMSTMQQQHKEQMSSMQQQIDQLKQLVLVNQSTVKTTTQPNKPSEY